MNLQIIDIDDNHIHATKDGKHYEIVIETPTEKTSNFWIRHQNAPRGLLTTDFPMQIWNDIRSTIIDNFIKELNDEKTPDINLN